MNLFKVVFFLIISIFSGSYAFCGVNSCSSLLSSRELGVVQEKIELKKSFKGQDLAGYIELLMKFDRGFISNVKGEPVLKMTKESWDQYFPELDVFTFLENFEDVSLVRKQILEDGSVRVVESKPVVKGLRVLGNSGDYIYMVIDQDFMSFLRAPRQYGLLDYLEVNRSSDSILLKKIN